MSESPSLQPAPGFTWGKGPLRARVGSSELVPGWGELREDYVASIPTILSSKDRRAPPQERPGVTLELPPLLGQTSSRVTSQTSPYVRDAEKQTHKSSSPTRLHPHGGKSRWGINHLFGTKG